MLEANSDTPWTSHSERLIYSLELRHGLPEGRAVLIPPSDSVLDVVFDWFGTGDAGPVTGRWGVGT